MKGREDVGLGAENMMPLANRASINEPENSDVGNVFVALRSLFDRYANYIAGGLGARMQLLSIDRFGNRKQHPFWRISRSPVRWQIWGD